MLGDSKQVRLSESTRRGAAGDKGSGLMKGANWRVSVKPIFNFTLIWKVKGSKLVRKSVTGSKHIEGNHYSAWRERGPRGKGPLQG